MRQPHIEPGLRSGTYIQEHERDRMNMLKLLAVLLLALICGHAVAEEKTTLVTSR
jgi:hypothetical protein